MCRVEADRRQTTADALARLSRQDTSCSMHVHDAHIVHYAHVYIAAYFKPCRMMRQVAAHS
jgi:hypothetical protein